MKRIAVALGLAVAVALTAATVFAWGPGRGMGPGLGMGQGFGHGYGAAAAVPNLSADQAAKIQKIQSDRYAEAQTVRSEMYAKKIELQALFREPVLDQAKIASKQKEIAALQDQMPGEGTGRPDGRCRDPYPRAAGATPGRRSRVRRWPRQRNGFREPVVGKDVPGGTIVSPGTSTKPKSGGHNGYAAQRLSNLSIGHAHGRCPSCS